VPTNFSGSIRAKRKVGRLSGKVKEQEGPRKGEKKERVGERSASKTSFLLSGQAEIGITKRVRQWMNRGYLSGGRRTGSPLGGGHMQATFGGILVAQPTNKGNLDEKKGTLLETGARVGGGGYRLSSMKAPQKGLWGGEKNAKKEPKSWKGNSARRRARSVNP